MLAYIVHCNFHFEDPSDSWWLVTCLRANTCIDSQYNASKIEMYIFWVKILGYLPFSFPLEINTVLADDNSI